MPYWCTHFLRVNAADRLTGKASRNASLFFDQGYVRIQDFVDRHGALPTKEVCLAILDGRFETSDQRNRAAGFVSRQFRRLTGVEVSGTPACGPHLPAGQCAASHGWTFGQVIFVEGDNHEFYHLLHKLPVIKRLPHTSLGIANEPAWKDLWRRERSLDRDLLPILADIKFRLQHNGLNVRKKYRHQTDDVLCVHGCPVVEDAEHLFWRCPVATSAWTLFLTNYRHLLTTDVTWETVVYLQGLVFTPTAVRTRGAHNMLRVFNVIRCSVLYMVWLHHNDCMLNGTPTNSKLVTQRAKAYIQLHLRRIQATGNPRLHALCSRWLPADQHADSEGDTRPRV